MDADSVQLPAWDLTSEYAGLNDPKIEKDFEELSAAITSIRGHAAKISPLLPKIKSIGQAEGRRAVEAAQAVARLRDRAAILGFNLLNYAKALEGCDPGAPSVIKIRSRAELWLNDLEQAVQPIELFLKAGDRLWIEFYFSDPAARAEEHRVNRMRELALYSLSLSEEEGVTALAVNGLHEWGSLYTRLVGGLQVNIEGNSHGVAAARKFQTVAEPALRREASEKIDQAYRSIELPCAAAWNAIAGWRTTLASRRSTKAPVKAFDLALHASALSPAGFRAFWGVVSQGRELGQRANRLRARALGKERLDLWDSQAPDPGLAHSIPFEEAIEWVESAFRRVSPEMGDFVQTARKKKWIEARLLPRKESGAYATLFPKSRTPMVFLSYLGGLGDVVTLAHELGHAYHQWVQRNLPFVQTRSPTTLSETASTFAEACLIDLLIDDPRYAKAALLQEAAKISLYLLHLPMRFQIEHEVHDRKANGEPLTVTDFDDITARNWRQFFGDTYAQVDSAVWLKTLHNYLTKISYYNFPYTFGFLFSYALFEQHKATPEPDEFHRRYVELLRETGSATCDRLAREYLGVDLADSGFWVRSLAPLNARMDILEKTL